MKQFICKIFNQDAHISKVVFPVYTEHTASIFYIVVQATKSFKSNFSSYTIAVLVIACNRPDAVKKCLNGLLKHRPSREQFPIIVSQDCGDDATAQAISTYGNQVFHIKQPDLSNINISGNMRRFQGYYKISRHYKWALGQVFDEMPYENVLIVEDDLEIGTVQQIL